VRFEGPGLAPEATIWWRWKEKIWARGRVSRYGHFCLPWSHLVTPSHPSHSLPRLPDTPPAPYHLAPWRTWALPALSLHISFHYYARWQWLKVPQAREKRAPGSSNWQTIALWEDCGEATPGCDSRSPSLRSPRKGKT
jgi:hypothetical protein